MVTAIALEITTPSNDETLLDKFELGGRDKKTLLTLLTVRWYEIKISHLQNGYQLRLFAIKIFQSVYSWH